MPAALTIDHLRCYAIKRSLFKRTTLPRAVSKLGFVQIDPIRAPARAQDLTLRLRVRDYRAGDLEARYPRQSVGEDVFINYGGLPRTTQRLMHPRTARTEWPRSRRLQAHAVLEFVRSLGLVHPHEVDTAFEHGRNSQTFGPTKDERRTTGCSRRLLRGRVARRTSVIDIFQVGRQAVQGREKPHSQVPRKDDLGGTY